MLHDATLGAVGGLRMTPLKVVAGIRGYESLREDSVVPDGTQDFVPLFPPAHAGGYALPPLRGSVPGSLPATWLAENEFSRTHFERLRGYDAFCGLWECIGASPAGRAQDDPSTSDRVI